MYHVRMILIPGKGELLVVGGSEDAECTRMTDKVQLFDNKGNVENRKPICKARSKVGLAVSQLCSEVNALFKKTFVYVFGGVDMTGNAIKICEKYNLKANVWQSMPNLSIARYCATGQTLGDYLYVFGGIVGGDSIKRLNLK